MAARTAKDLGVESKGMAPGCMLKIAAASPMGKMIWKSEEKRVSRMIQYCYNRNGHTAVVNSEVTPLVTAASLASRLKRSFNYILFVSAKFP
jgi:hypothetical protein